VSRLLYAGAACSLAVFLLAVFRFEFELPLRIGVFLVPAIVGTGFAVAWLVHFQYGLAMYEAFGVLAGALFVLALVYDLWPRGGPGRSRGWRHR
jgi:hypothetical protein